jgi:hypothetical protein
MLRPALLCLALLCPLPALAQPPGDCGPPPLPSQALMEDLLDWIEAETDYDTAPARAALPVISFCETGEVIAYDGDDMMVDAGLRAAYDFSRAHIYLVLPWDAEDPYDASVLLHELVHHVQLTTRTWDCIGAPEWEAYKLQERYLGQHGIDPDFDWLHIYMMSRCPRDIHPD